MIEIDALKRENDPELLIKYREKEKLRKRQRRAKNNSKKDNIKKQKAEIRKRKRNCEYKQEISHLNEKLKLWEHEQKIVETKFIFMGPCTPMKTTKKGYIFKEEEESVRKYRNF